jgi:hypothetical protein
MNYPEQFFTNFPEKVTLYNDSLGIPFEINKKKVWASVKQNPKFAQTVQV